MAGHYCNNPTHHIVTLERTAHFLPKAKAETERTQDHHPSPPPRPIGLLFLFPLRRLLVFPAALEIHGRSTLLLPLQPRESHRYNSSPCWCCTCTWRWRQCQSKSRAEAAVMALQDRVISRLVAVSLLLLLCTTRCEARAMGRLQSKSSNPLLNALFKLNFIRRVEPAHLPPPATGDADAASLAAADGSNSPFCLNPPDAPPSTTTPPFTSTPSTPAIPDQPPPLPSITPVPPSFEPSPPASGAPGGQGPGDQGPPTSTTPNPPQLGPSTPAGTVPPSPPESGPGSGSGGPFLPPIVYPPPLAPPQQPGAGQPLWCVAKPTVPDPIIQEAMDYACGSGAECGSVQPSGACYQPNTVLAHASFAFNSYWQQTRAAGGTCDFGGTATIVTRDPSYEKCKFDLL